MSHTVIGIFHEEENTIKAVRKLMEDGISSENIDICERREYMDSEKGFAYKDHGNKIGEFMRFLFGTSNEINDYTEKAMKGSVITVHAQSMEEAERASDIMDLYGAVDWSERAAHYRNSEEGERLPLKSRIFNEVIDSSQRWGNQPRENLSRNNKA